jgi:hypothetical protein
MFEEAGAKGFAFSLGMDACFICSKILLRCIVLVSAHEVDTSNYCDPKMSEKKKACPGI